jgi:hypothetical protein
MKVAEMAFRGMGTAFEDNTLDALNQFKERLISAVGAAVIDKDLDAIADRQELTFAQGRLTRGNSGKFSRGF